MILVGGHYNILLDGGEMGGFCQVGQSLQHLDSWKIEGWICPHIQELPLCTQVCNVFAIASILP
jgi:hypothetical protein